MTALTRALGTGRNGDGQPLTRRQIRDHVKAILGAGSLTVAATLPWVFHELSKNPDVADGVRQEVDATLGGQPVTDADLPRLSYCARVIHETLRLHSPQWLLSRRTVAPVVLGTARIPAGSTVAYSLYALHRDPRWHRDPLRFDPDRWLTKDSAPCPRSAFIPFSTGSGRCLGDRFAMAELITCLASIAAGWVLRDAPGEAPHEVVGLTVRPSRWHMICEPR